MGGFHIALNYLSLLGKFYTSSCLEDLLIDSVLYAADTINASMGGKSYNRGVSAHKLCLAALFRLLWRAFISWLERKKSCFQDASKDEVLELIQKCHETEGGPQDNWQPVRDGPNSLITLVGEFRSEARAKSNLFAFWDQYLSVVMTLLQFIKAERTGD